MSSMTKSQRSPAEQQILLTGSAFHEKHRKIIPATWIILTLTSTVDRHFYFKLAHEGSSAHAATVAEEVTSVRGSHSLDTRIPQVTCMQNSRIILSKYLNVKLLTHNYSGGQVFARGRSATGGTGETGKSSRLEVRGFQNFNPELRTSSRAFLASLARLASAICVCIPVDSKLTCPVYVAHDLSASFFRVFQPRAEILSRPVGLGWTIGGTSDPWVGPLRAGWARPVSISRPSAW